MKECEYISYRVLQVICLVLGVIFLVGGGASMSLTVGSFAGYGLFGIAANLTRKS